MYSPSLIFSIISVRNFTYKNKNSWPLLSSCFTKFFTDPIYYVAVEAEMYKDLREPDDIRSLFQVYVIYLKKSSYCCCKHYSTAISFT